jgi:hypothetical protein
MMLPSLAIKRLEDLSGDYTDINLQNLSLKSVPII